MDLPLGSGHALAQPTRARIFALLVKPAPRWPPGKSLSDWASTRTVCASTSSAYMRRAWCSDCGRRARGGDLAISGLSPPTRAPTGPTPATTRTWPAGSPRHAERADPAARPRRHRPGDRPRAGAGGDRRPDRELPHRLRHPRFPAGDRDERQRRLHLPAGKLPVPSLGARESRRDLTLHRGLSAGLLSKLDPNAELTRFEPRDPDSAGCVVGVKGLGSK